MRFFIVLTCQAAFYRQRSGCNLRQGPRVCLTGEGSPGSTCEKESAEHFVQGEVSTSILLHFRLTSGTLMKCKSESNILLRSNPRMQCVMETSPIVSPISCTIMACLWWQGLVCVSGGMPHYPHKPSIAKALVRQPFRLPLRLCGGCHRIG